MKIILFGQPKTKKNSPRIIKARGHPMILPSKAYEDYEKSCLEQLRWMYGDIEPVQGRVSISCMYYLQDDRRCDLANLLEATQDILVKAGFLADDDKKHISPIKNIDYEIDRKNPRVVVDITPTEEGNENETEAD